MKMTSKQYNRSAYAFMFLGSLLGYVLALTYSPLIGLPLFAVAGAVGVLAPPVARRLETRERFIAEYGTYEGFRARAREVIDYEWLFRIRDARSRRWLIRSVMVQAHLPRPYAERFVDSLTDDERPRTLPPSPSSPTQSAPRKGDAT